MLSNLAGKGNTAEILVFYSGRYLRDIVSLITQDYFMKVDIFSKNLKSCYSRVVGPPRAPQRISQTLTSPSNNHTFLENSAFKRAYPIFD